MLMRNRTTCPFCLNGCESEVVFDGYQYRMEYPSDAVVNRGRLCPRGNSASIVLDHPRRLGYPLLDGREVSWEQALEYCRRALAAGQDGRLAIAYSRGLTSDELDLVWGFARAVRAQLLVCGYIEPGNLFGQKVAGVREAGLDDVRGAKTILLAGDVFATSPVAGGMIVEWRYANRQNRLVVIDSLRTVQDTFAHLSIRVQPGAEPFALLGIAALLGAKIGLGAEQLAAAAGVELGQLQAAANILKTGSAFVGSAAGLGRTALPSLHNYASQLLAVQAKATFTGFAEGRVRLGPNTFEQLRQAAATNTLRTLFWFGSLHPLSYTELFPETAQIEHIVVTSIFRPIRPLRGLVLPVPSELEKESTGVGYWGAVRRRPLAAPFSGSRRVGQILEELATIAPMGEPTVAPAGAEVIADLARAELARWQNPSSLQLVGEKRAIGLGGLYADEQDVSVSPDNELGQTADEVVLRTSTSERTLRLRRAPAVPAGTAVVGVNARENRALFGIVADAAGAPAMPPAAVELRPTTSSRRYPLEVAY